jgi:hypothetical protein
MEIERLGPRTLPRSSLASQLGLHKSPKKRDIIFKYTYLTLTFLSQIRKSTRTKVLAMYLKVLDIDFQWISMGSKPDEIFRWRASSIHKRSQEDTNNFNRIPTSTSLVELLLRRHRPQRLRRLSRASFLEEDDHVPSDFPAAENSRHFPQSNRETTA